MTTRAVATLFAVVLALGAVVQVFLPLRARAAQPPPQAKCVHIGTVKADAVFTRLFSDADGDWWMVIRYASTGELQIGVLMRNGQFCIAGEGRTNRET